LQRCEVKSFFSTLSHVLGPKLIEIWKITSVVSEYADNKDTVNAMYKHYIKKVSRGIRINAAANLL
jgi:hypothetical protein